MPGRQFVRIFEHGSQPVYVIADGFVRQLNAGFIRRVINKNPMRLRPGKGIRQNTGNFVVFKLVRMRRFEKIVACDR